MKLPLRPTKKTSRTRFSRSKAVRPSHKQGYHRIENKICSLSQYMEIISSIHSKFPLDCIHNPISELFLYRGVCNQSYSLLPSILRRRNDKVQSNEMGSRRYTSFVSEKSILTSFKVEASVHVNIPENDLLRWAEYAQHFGVPTRFLDWTSNPLVALFFACIGDCKEHDGAVWLFNMSNYSNYYLQKNMIDGELPPERTKREIILSHLEGNSKDEFPILYLPLYIESRMSAQSSYFMVWGAKQEPLEVLLKDHSDMRLNINTNKIDNEEMQPRTILYKSIVPMKYKQKLLRELDLAGINEKTLFPGLDGVGKYIERKFRFEDNDFTEWVGDLDSMKL